MGLFTHAIAFGHIIVVAQRTHRHICDDATAIDEQWCQWEDKRAQNSPTKVSSCTIIICLSQCTMVIMTV